MLPRENFEGPHVWDNRKTLPQDSRTRQAGRARRAGIRGPKFEIFGTLNPELWIAYFSHISRITRHGP